MSHETDGLAPAEVLAVRIVGLPATGVAGEVVNETLGTRSVTQALIAGSPRRVYTPGTFCLAHGSEPHETTPASVNAPPRGTSSGPPESPRHESLSSPPAHTIELALNAFHWAAHAASLTIGIWASRSVVEGWLPSGLVAPQPRIVARVPGVSSVSAAAPLPMIGIGSCCARWVRCKSATSKKTRAAAGVDELVVARMAVRLIDDDELAVVAPRAADPDVVERARGEGAVGGGSVHVAMTGGHHPARG